ncbi:MAG TPA: hypothetical protein ENK02_01485 [Planctomycetes bacterium]|nr:hypothetical protein [Planctomycetota bacterium]
MSRKELEELISADEIRARRGAGGIRVNKKDIDARVQGAALGDELTEELIFADEDDDSTGMATEILEDDSLLEEEDTLELTPDALEVEEEIEEAPEVLAPVASNGNGRPVRGRSRAAALRKDEKEEEEPSWVKALFVVTGVFLFFGLFVAWSISKGQTTQITKWLADMFQK